MQRREISRLCERKGPNLTNRQTLVLALTTFPNEKGAKSVAKKLVEERLAACVWVMPGMTSYYRWNDKLQKAPEHLVVIKTRRSLVTPLEKRLHELHPYAVPEFIVIPASLVSEKYLKWALSVTEGKDDKP